MLVRIASIFVFYYSEFDVTGLTKMSLSSQILLCSAYFCLYLFSALQILYIYL